MTPTLKDGRKIIIKREPPTDDDKDALAEALAKVVTGGDYIGYVHRLTAEKTMPSS